MSAYAEWGTVGADGQSYPEAVSENAHYREAALQAVQSAHRQQSSPYYGYFRAGIHQKVYLLPSFQDAFAWVNSIADDRVRRQKRGEAANYDYMAIFAAQDLRNPVWHEFPHFWDPYPHSVGNWLPFFIGLPLGGLGGYFLRRWQEQNPGQALPGVPPGKLPAPQIPPPPSPPPAAPPKASSAPTSKVSGDPYVGGSWVNLVGQDYYDGYSVGAPWVDLVGQNYGYSVGESPWVDLIGAQQYGSSDAERRRTWPQTRALIESAKREVSDYNALYPAAAWVWSLDPAGLFDRPGVELMGGHTMVTPFTSVQQAQDFIFSRIQTAHVALALFDTSSEHWPNPIRWTKSDNPTYEPLIAQHVAMSSPVRASGTYADAWDTAIGSALDDVRVRARNLASKRAGSVIGVLHSPKDGPQGLWHVLAFRSPDDADDWLNTATQDQSAYTYAAYFDKEGDSWPNPYIEKIGGHGRPAPGPRPRRALIVGATRAEIEGYRRIAQQLATTRPGQAVGVMDGMDGRGLWSAFSFASLDDAIDWLASATDDKRSFSYAAAFEKGSDGRAYFQQEEFGERPTLPQEREPFRRGIATTSGEWWAA